MSESCSECKKVKVVENRPGLASISYRIGTHARFKEDMLALLSQNPELVDLTTRQDDDLSIALFDCWATVADVLSFYQERIANEGFLRTAKERRSIKELARSVGYELRPGVAASTFLAFTMEEAPGAPERTIVGARTKVQSVPAAGETPQIFETIEEIEARPEWNRLRPKIAVKQTIEESQTSFIVRGVNTMLRAGDVLLVVTGGDEDEKFHTIIRTVVSVKADIEKQVTTIDIAGTIPAVPAILPKLVERARISLPELGRLDDATKLLLVKNLSKARFTESQLRLYSRVLGWKKLRLSESLNFRIRLPPKPSPPKWTERKLPEPQIGVYAFRSKASFFGHNAPQYDSLPSSARKPYPRNWDKDDSISIATNSKGEEHADDFVYLDSAYPSIVQNSWVILHSPARQSVYRITKSHDKSLADYAMSTKVTGLQLSSDDLASTEMITLNKFKVRDTTAYLQSEMLELADVLIKEPVEGGSIELDRIVPDLKVGQHIVVTGETLFEDEPTGLTESEVAKISDIVHDGGHTVLSLATGLKNRYRRDAVTINANVATATHGETKEEEVGSGDPAKSMQEFTLKQRPLTFVASSAASIGAASTLQVYVDNILWRQANDIYSLGPSDRAYVLKIENEDASGYGSSRIIFGDGQRGRKLPAGTNNVVARYRVGMGSAGSVKEGQLSLLQTRPLGVRSVTNPVSAIGAADPERMENARQNAPLPLLAMGRIVSLNDFESYAQAFSGIGKARAEWAWDGEQRVVLLTIASDGGDVVPETSQLYVALAGAVNASKDPSIDVHIKSFEPRAFKVAAKVAVKSGHMLDNVRSAVRDALLKAFSFESREFARGVDLSTIVSVIQQVEGVMAADVDFLYPVEHPESEPRLDSSVDAPGAHWKNGQMVAATLLTIDPDGITISEMKI